MAVLPPDKRPMKNFSSKKKGKKGKRLTREERLKKRKNTRNMVLGGIFFVFLLIWWGTMPIKGGIDFGICRTFAELREEYPSTMKIRAVETFDQALRIFYTVKDPYGNERSRMIECVVLPHPQTIYAMQSVSIDREEVEDLAFIERFNKSIPGIIDADPDLVIPGGYGEDLMSLKIE